MNYDGAVSGGGAVLPSKAWRIKLSIELVGKLSNNLLEHVMAMTHTWIDMFYGAMSKDDFYLSFEENASATIWLHLARFFMIDHEAHEQRLAQTVTHAFSGKILRKNTTEWQIAYQETTISLKKY